MEKLVYGKRIENLIEIAMTYAALSSNRPELKDTDSITWKAEFVEWANEFEQIYPEVSQWEDNDYLDCIECFAKKRIYEFAGLALTGMK